VRYRPQGDVEFLGRLDHQVKLRGFRIEPGEIEAELARHPEVREAAVILREDRPGEKRLVGYAVASPENGPSGSELRDFLKETLPAYMVPAAVVRLDALPLTPNGKLDRRALPAPDFTGHEEEEFVAPETEVEELLAEIWAELLELERVSVLADFFDLGGHSLLLPQLFARMSEVFQLDLPLRLVVEAPTVAEMAMLVEERLLEEIEAAEAAEE